MKNETTKGSTIIRAIATGNIRQLNNATGNSNKIDGNDLIATFYYLIREGECTSFHSFYPPLKESDLNEMIEGACVGESIGYGSVSTETLTKMAEVLDCYTNLKTKGQLNLIDKYRNYEQTTA